MGELASQRSQELERREVKATKTIITTGSAGGFELVK